MGLTAKAIVQEVERLGDERDVCRDQVFKLDKQLAQAYTNADTIRAMNLAHTRQRDTAANERYRAEAEVDRLRQVNVEYAQQVGQLTKRVENQSGIITSMRERSLERLNKVFALQKLCADLNAKLMATRQSFTTHYGAEIARLEELAAERLKRGERADRALLLAAEDTSEKEARIEKHLATIKRLKEELTEEKSWQTYDTWDQGRWGGQEPMIFRNQKRPSTKKESN